MIEDRTSRWEHAGTEDIALALIFLRTYTQGYNKPEHAKREDCVQNDIQKESFHLKSPARDILHVIKHFYTLEVYNKNKHIPYHKLPELPTGERENHGRSRPFIPAGARL